MSDQDNGPGKILQGGNQRLPALHIQMVGRFVQKKDIGPQKEKRGQNQPGFLPAAQAAHRIGPIVFPKKEKTQNRSYFLLVRAPGQPLYLLQNRIALLEHLGLVLGVIPDFDLAAYGYISSFRGDHPGHDL